MYSVRNSSQRLNNGQDKSRKLYEEMFDYSILYTLRRGEQNKCGFILEFVALPKKLTLHYVLAEVTIHFVPRSFRHMTFLSHTTIEGEDESTVKMHGGECV